MPIRDNLYHSRYTILQGISKRKRSLETKFLLLLLIMILPSILAPRLANGRLVTPLVKCLGDEEMNFYLKKKQGPDYFLNQYFINALAGANDARLKADFLDKICRDPDHGPAVSLLKHLTLHGLTLFDIRLNDLNQHENNVTALWAIEEELTNTFMNYLSNLQGETEDPKCLIKEIPELTYFFDRLKYLEPDLRSKELLRPKEKVIAIFEKIKNFEKIKRKCKPKLKADK